jgi:hypothetical protein
MKLATFIIVLFLSDKCLSQHLTVNTKYGYAVGETRVVKKVMLYNSLDIGAELRLRGAISFNIGIGGATLQYSSTDTPNVSVYCKRYFLTLPVCLKKYYHLTKNSSAFFQVGLMNSFSIHEKKEFLSAGRKGIVNANWAGYNLGLLVSTCFRTKMSQNDWYIGISIGGQQDILTAYKNENQKIKHTVTAIGLSVTKIF